MKNLIHIIIYLCCITLPIQAQLDTDWLIMGNNNLNSSNLMIALENYTEHIQNNPEDPMGYIYRGTLYRAMGRENESNQDLKFAQKLNPFSLMLIDPSLRSKYTAKKSFAFNYQNLDQSFIKSPSRFKDYQKVINKFDLNKQDKLIISEVISLLNDLKIDEAQSKLESIEKSSVNAAIVYDLFGKIKMKKEDYFSAIDYFNKALEVDPSFSIAYHNRSICQKLLGNFEEAKKDLDKAIGLNSDVSIFFFTEAKLYEKIGEPDKAIESYELALENDSNYKEAMINYSQLLKGLGDYSQGLKYMNRAIGDDDDNPETIFLQANLDFIYGEFEDAISGYNEYLDYFPSDASSKFNKGLSKVLLREYDEGCEDMESGLNDMTKENHHKIYKMFCLQNLETQ